MEFGLDLNLHFSKGGNSFKNRPAVFFCFLTLLAVVRKASD